MLEQRSKKLASSAGRRRAQGERRPRSKGKGRGPVARAQLAQGSAHVRGSRHVSGRAIGTVARRGKETGRGSVEVQRQVTRSTPWISITDLRQKALDLKRCTKLLSVTDQKLEDSLKNAQGAFDELSKLKNEAAMAIDGCQQGRRAYRGAAAGAAAAAGAVEKECRRVPGCAGPGCRAPEEPRSRQRGTRRSKGRFRQMPSGRRSRWRNSTNRR